MVLLSFDEEDIASVHTVGEGAVRAFGRAGTDPERGDFDEPATGVMGFVGHPTPGTISLGLEVQFRDGGSVRVSVHLIS